MKEDEINEVEGEEKLEVMSFNEALDSLIIFSEKVLVYGATGELNLSSMGAKSNAFQTALNSFRVLYNKNRDLPGYINRFREVYNTCRPQFVKDVSMETFMTWFADKSSFIITPQAGSKSKIYLSIIFRKCANISANISADSEKYPQKAEELLNDPAAVYPEHFMIALFRIFYHCAEQIDRQTMIVPRIEELERSLGLNKNEVPQTGDFMAQVMDGGRDFLEEMTGQKLPKNMKLPPGMGNMDIKSMMKGFTSDPGNKEKFQKIFKGVDCKNPAQIPNIVSNLMTSMAEAANEVPEAVKRANAATADNQTATSSS